MIKQVKERTRLYTCQNDKKNKSSNQYLPLLILFVQDEFKKIYK